MHTYSTSFAEVNSGGFGYEALSFYLYNTNASGTVPYYRCRSGTSSKTFLTASSSCESLPSGYVDSLVGYIATSLISDTVPVYRSYFPNSGDHLYTSSSREHSAAINAGYLSEGVPGYVWTTP
jgi:hypothetical protein